MPNLPKLETEIAGNDYREHLSTWVAIISILAVVALAFIMIYLNTDKETRQMVFTAVLPLFGAWVGTILAFYYGKENFEASARSFTRIAESVGLTERLKEIPVANKMIARKDMIFDDRPADKIKLTEILSKLSEKERLPILNEKGAIIYMIHKSAINDYLAKTALNPPSPPKPLQDYTLQDILQTDSKLKDLFERSFGFVKENATLADAKTEMERLSKCQDVFVTQSGNKAEPIIGWITNNIIQEIAKL